jgi:hypothetical protein
VKEHGEIEQLFYRVQIKYKKKNPDLFFLYKSFSIKNFAKNILSILNSIKAKEESEQKQEALAAQRSPIRDVKYSFN